MVKIDATTRRRQRATEVEQKQRELPKNLKLVLRAKYDNSILVKIFPKLFKILFHYTKSPAGIHGPLNLARGIDSTDEPVQ